MSTNRNIPPQIRDVQIDAADPDVSAFVSANAGSGKTHVLAQRVINLLLRGVDPAKILCITFTKAASANMANRVFGTLAKWTGLDDAALDREIGLSIRGKPGAAQRARARRLFASALETPGGLKVQTIHAFCTRLLHQFPFEANVAARFTVLDEAATTQLLDELTLAVLLEAAGTPQSPLGRALERVIVVAADVTFKDLVGEAIRQRDAIEAWMARAGSVDAAMAELSQSFGLDPADTLESVEQHYFSHSLLPAAEWPQLIEILESGSANDKRHISALQAARAARGREQIEEYLKVFCTTELEPRKNVITKSLAQRHPDWLERLIAERDRVCELIARERALAARERSRALITIAAEVIARYRTEKDRRALLDYDDLIDKTLALFSRSSAAWVLYKLDLGIDHVLIDEAQDTSPKQWRIISTIVSEFMQSGARPEAKRTIFAVGDEKQSIFSFQGAAPRAFDQMRREFERQFGAADQGWRYLRFHHSFRSGANVLGSVDRVFSDQDVYLSVTEDAAGVPPHESLPDAAPGMVEIWPLEKPAERREIEGWDAPFDTLSEQSPQALLAAKIAAQVRHLAARGSKAGDVLILVRQRGPLFEAVIRALKDAGLPVAGADRLVLTEHIAVMDLMALGDALLLADNDLALASVLKSPLFGLTEEQLFTLAWDRKGSLRASLRAKAGADAGFAAASNALDELAAASRQLSPFAFYAQVLGARRGRAKFLARLGPEANDALDEFLNLALDYESRETPSLQGFLNWLRAAQSEVKRDMEMVRDEVRVMTVHGAKGLEAKTVILADTTTKPTGPKDPRLLPLGNNALVWATARSEDVGAMTDARVRAQRDARDEYRRLLYVAMTRAAERLIVCGVQGRQKIPEGCWYELVFNALEADCVAEPSDIGGDVLRYRKTPAEREPKAEAQAATPAAPAILPAWLTRDAAAEPQTIRTVTPSSAIDDEANRPVAGGERTAALLRGTLMHRLLQSLPDIAADRRAAAAEKFMARAGSALPKEERVLLVDRALFLLNSDQFGALFGPNSRSEVPIVGRIERGGNTVRVSGQIDRLAVTDDAILIADYKTNRPAPRRIEDVPDNYKGQLALYRAVLEKLYPGRPIRAALIWTETTDLMELSGPVLDAALAQVTSA
jgi:ATP-dependent helicase/nuclease subunit A